MLEFIKLAYIQDEISFLFRGEQSFLTARCARVISVKSNINDRRDVESRSYACVFMVRRINCAIPAMFYARCMKK